MTDVLTIPFDRRRRSNRVELLWTLRKGIDRKTAALRTHGGGGELQVSHNGEWYYGRRHEVRAFALDEAAACRRDLEKDGWTEERNAMEKG